MANFNGGILPGLAGETNTIGLSTPGQPLPFNHGSGPVMESILHLMGHLSTGMPVDGEAPPPNPTRSPSGSAAGSVVDLSSGFEQSSDSDGGHPGEYSDQLATVAGPRLASFGDLSLRLTEVRGAAAGGSVPLSTGIGLEAFRSDPTCQRASGRAASHPR